MPPSSYQSLSSLVQSQSNSSLRSMGRSMSMTSIGGDSQAAKWDQHVAMNNRRNERIRMQSEATKLRSAFVQFDPRLDGVIAKFNVKSCMLAGGVELPADELKMIMHQYISNDGAFSWRRFCDDLEKGKIPSSGFHPRSSLRPVTSSADMNMSRGSISSKFLAAKNSRRTLTTAQSGASLLQSASGASLVSGKSSQKLRNMVSGATMLGAKAPGLMSTASWHAKTDGFGMPPAGPATAAPLMPTFAPGPMAAPEEFYMPEPAAPMYSPPKKKKFDEEEFAREEKLKGLIGMASTGMNSRFSDMYKAFQYIDLDRSGRLSKKEISRALDLWNVPVDDAKLDLLMGKCDADDDGGISYEEFVDALARDTVSNAAMGKRGMQSKDAMGVDSQEMLAHQLGHTKLAKFDPSINAK